MELKITIGEKVFTAIMCDNATVKEFAAKLPMTLNMSELNGNEKYHNFSKIFCIDSPSPAETIHAGDIMCRSSNCLAIFYKTFSSSYNYVRLGRIEDASGLKAALGKGSVHVTFTLD